MWTDGLYLLGRSDRRPTQRESRGRRFREGPAKHGAAVTRPSDRPGVMKVVLFRGGMLIERAETDDNRQIRPWMVWNAPEYAGGPA
jgi:hypothetical protein